MDNYNKINILFQKLDNGSISDFEINELNSIIDNGNFDSSVINSDLDSQLNSLNYDISDLNNVHTNEYLDDYLNKFNNKISNVDTSIINNNIDLVNVTNIATNNLANGLVLSSKFTSIIASISFLSIIGISYFTYNYFSNQKNIVKNEYLINDNNKKYNKGDISIEANKGKSDHDLENQISNSINTKNENNIDSNISKTNNKPNLNTKTEVNKDIESENINLKIKQLKSDKDFALYSDEILSIFVQNNDDFNKILQSYTNQLKIAQKNDDFNSQLDVLYKLAIIYRVKNISNEKSIEILNKAISLIDNSQINENQFKMIKIDLYGELYKSYKSLGNNKEANFALKKCINYLNKYNLNSENKMVVGNKTKYWNEILNSQQ